jgi:hypothetical protein
MIKRLISQLNDTFSENPFHHIITFTIFDFADPRDILGTLTKHITPITNDFFEKLEIKVGKEYVTHYFDLFQILEEFEESAKLLIDVGAITENFRNFYIVKLL